MISNESGIFSNYLRDARNSRGAKFVRGHRILDVGCNTGYLRRFLPPNVEYVGIDIHTQPVDFTYYTRSVNDDLSDLGLFDSIVMLATIEHLKTYETVVRSLASKLKPGGRLIITTPTPTGDKLHHLGSRFGLVSSDAAEEHEKIFTLDELEKLFKEAGMEIVTAHTFFFGLNQLIVGKV